MQPEPPSVQRTAEALERLRISDAVREEVGFAHSYELRDQDLEMVETFAAIYGELPPSGYFRRLWWWLRGGEG